MTSDEWQVTSGRKVRFGEAPEAGRCGERSTVSYANCRRPIRPSRLRSGQDFHLSEEIFELLDRQTGVTDNCSHLVGIDRIIPRARQL